MEAVITLDRELTMLFQNFARTAAALQFTEICDLRDETTVAQQQYRGLYKVDIKNDGVHPDPASWFRWFSAEWTRPEYRSKSTPSLKQKRMAAHRELHSWIPLYIGKSKNIAGRVLEHLNLALTQPTTALKLKARTNLADQALRLSTLKVDVENYDLIVPSLESAQRELHHPVLGRQ